MKTQCLMKITVAQTLQNPPVHLTEALSDEFLETINAGLIADIQLVKMQKRQFSGYVNIGALAATRPTIYLNSREFNSPRHCFQPSADRIRAVYIHELAHLLSQEGHTLYFSAINCVMHVRAGLIDQVKRYDVQDMRHERRASGMHAALMTAEHFANDNRPILDMLDDIRHKSQEFEESIRGAPWAYKNEKQAIIERDKAEHRAWSAILWMRFSFLVIAMLGFRLMIS